MAVLPGLSSPVMRMLMRHGKVQRSNELNRVPEGVPVLNQLSSSKAWTNQATYGGSEMRSADVKQALAHDVELGIKEYETDTTSETCSDSGHRP